MPKLPLITTAAFSLPDDLDPRRRAVIDEAMTWVGTPYAHMARVKGAGCDCVTMMAEVFEAAGITDHIEIPFYPPDWNLHRDTERYLAGLLQHTTEYDRFGYADITCVPLRPMKSPEPGDIVLYKFGRCFAHAVLVTQWPWFIHAWIGHGVMHGSDEQPQLSKREKRFFDPFVTCPTKTA